PPPFIQPRGCSRLLPVRWADKLVDLNSWTAKKDPARKPEPAGGPDLWSVNRRHGTAVPGLAGEGKEHDHQQRRQGHANERSHGQGLLRGKGWRGAPLGRVAVAGALV